MENSFASKSRKKQEHLVQFILATDWGIWMMENAKIFLDKQASNKVPKALLFHCRVHHEGDQRYAIEECYSGLAGSAYLSEEESFYH